MDNQSLVKQEKNKIPKNVMYDERGRLKKGYTANPYGRPKKGKCISDILAKFAEKKLTLKSKETGKLVTKKRKEWLADVAWKLAISGDIPAIRFITEYLDGKPAINIESDEEKEIKVVILHKEV